MHLGGPLLVLGSSAWLQCSAALATTVFAVYGPLGTGALRSAFAAPILLSLDPPSRRSPGRACSGSASARPRRPGVGLVVLASGGVTAARAPR